MIWFCFYYRKCLAECHIPVLGHVSVHLSADSVRSSPAVFDAGVWTDTCLLKHHFPATSRSHHMSSCKHLPLTPVCVSPPTAAVHPCQLPAGQLLVVHRAVCLHVPGQPVCHHLSVLFSARLLGLPALCLRLHVSADGKGWAKFSNTLCGFWHLTVQ